jgi:transcriptional regulator with XRE-family HTH domain
VPQPTSAQLGSAIRHIRDSRELSIEALAADADMHWTSVSRIENGRQNPTWDAVAKLAMALDVEIGDLARLAAEQPPRERRSAPSRST